MRANHANRCHGYYVARDVFLVVCTILLAHPKMLFFPQFSAFWRLCVMSNHGCGGFLRVHRGSYLVIADAVS